MAAKELINTSLYTDPNLNQYYQLESATATIGTNLTNTGSVTFTAAKFNNGANLGSPNTTKYLSNGVSANAFASACSISGWHKPVSNPSSGNTQALLTMDGNSSGVRYRIDVVNTSGTITVNAHRIKAGAGDSIAGLTFTPSTSAFNFYVLTFDGSTLILYINGVNVASIAASGNGSSGILNDAFAIGTSSGGLGVTLADGLFDDVALFTRALSSTEVANLFNAVTVQSMTETVTVTDVISKNIGRSLIESIAMSGILAATRIKIITLLEHFALTDSAHKYINGLLAVYSNKYSRRGSSYSNKYSSRGSGYQDKYNHLQ